MIERALDGLSWAAPLTAAGAGALAYDLLRYGRLLSGPYYHNWAWAATPLWKGVFGLLLSPGGGLLVFVPCLALAPLAFPVFWRQHRAEASLVAALVLARLVFYGSWYDWEGGATWGPRYLLPIIPMLVLVLAYLEGKRALILLGALAAISLGIEVLAQLVPYGLYYGSVVPEVAQRLGICHCLPFPDNRIVPVQDVLHFDWHYSVLVFQLRSLLQGVIAPAWGPLLFLVAPLLTVEALLLRRLSPLRRETA